MFDYNSILTSTTIGKRRRLFRILGDTGKCIIVPLDDNLISSNNIGLCDLKSKLHSIECATPNGVLCYLGTAGLVRNFDIPIIVNISASTIQSKHTRKTLISSVEHAAKMDAAAVAVHINISSEYETEMLNNLGYVSEKCNEWGIPLIVIIYPRKEGDNNTDDNYEMLKKCNPEAYTDLVCHCVRVAFELGADIVKTKYTGSVDSFTEVVKAASGKPVLIAGGNMKDEESLLCMVRDAMKAGASGVSIGRNVFNRVDTESIISKIYNIVFLTSD